MRLMRILIVLILCVKSLYRALPVQSKALENTDDQLIWQAAWYSEDGKAASPFTGDSKKITAKSIFITPNFVNQAHYCPDGYRIDNGKCIKIISFHQTSEELLATRFSGTTDDTTDYDYDLFEDEQNNQNQEDIKLPLVPILHESNEDDSNNSIINAKNITVKEYETDVTTENSFISSSTFHDFRTEHKTDSMEIIITTLSSDDASNSNRNDTTYEHDNATIKPSVDEFHENSNDDDVNENEYSSTFSNTTTTPEQQQIEVTTSAATEIALEYENITEEISSNENETSVMQDRSSEDNQNVEPSFLLLPLAETLERENSTQNNNNNNNFTIIDSISNSTINIKNSSSYDNDDEILSNSTVLDFNENPQTEESIIESNFDDSSFLVNDSLIMIDNTSSILNSSNIADYDDITTVDPFMMRNDEDQTTLQPNRDATIDDNVSIKSVTTEENTSITDEDKPSAFKYETTSYYSLNSQDDDETNKFVYHHHVPSTAAAATTPTTIETSTHSVKGSKLKFPDEEINNRVRFPDDYNNNNDEIVTTQSRLTPSSSSSAISSRFSWPRENNHRLTTNIFQFWNQQPLLEDFQRARENSKSFRADDFFPYTRKVQIVTPQRYNY